jgi:transposase
MKFADKHRLDMMTDMVRAERVREMEFVPDAKRQDATMWLVQFQQILGDIADETNAYHRYLVTMGAPNTDALEALTKEQREELAGKMQVTTHNLRILAARLCVRSLAMLQEYDAIHDELQ